MRGGAWGLRKGRLEIGNERTVGIWRVVLVGVTIVVSGQTWGLSRRQSHILEADCKYWMVGSTVRVQSRVLIHPKLSFIIDHSPYKAQQRPRPCTNPKTYLDNAPAPAYGLAALASQLSNRAGTSLHAGRPLTNTALLSSYKPRHHASCILLLPRKCSVLLAYLFRMRYPTVCRTEAPRTPTGSRFLALPLSAWVLVWGRLGGG